MIIDNCITSTLNQNAYPGTIWPLDSIHEAMESLDGLFPVTIIDPNFTTSDHQLLASFEMTNFTNPTDPEGTVDYLGCLPEFKCTLNKKGFWGRTSDISTHEFLSSIAPEASPESIDQIIDLMTNILNKATASLSKQDYAFFALRVGVDQNTPSFHIDNSCTNSNAGPSFTFISVLKGPSTLYYSGSYDYAPDQTCLAQNNKNLLKQARHEYKIAGYTNTTALFDGSTFSALPGFATLHLANSENGAIHSTPKHTEPRLLLIAGLISGNCELPPMKK